MYFFFYTRIHPFTSAQNVNTSATSAEYPGKSVGFLRVVVRTRYIPWNASVSVVTGVILPDAHAQCKRKTRCCTHVKEIDCLQRKQ